MSSVKLGAAEGGMAELRTFPTPPPRAAGDREKPSLLWSLWRLSMWVGRRAERAQRVLRKSHLSRVGLAGSSGRKVTVRPRSAPGERPWRSNGQVGGEGGTPPRHTVGKARPSETA